MRVVFSGRIKLLPTEYVIDTQNITWRLAEIPRENVDSLYVYIARWEGCTIRILIGARHNEIVDIMATDSKGMISDAESVDLRFHGERRTSCSLEKPVSERRKMPR